MMSNPDGGQLEDSKGGKTHSGFYRPLCAVFHIIDGQLDLSLLSDHGVLKERHAAQVDRVAGALEDRRTTGVGGDKSESESLVSGETSV